MIFTVTGASGFIGQAVVAQALARGHEVRAVVRRASAAPTGAEEHVGDIADGAFVAKACEGAEAVIHLAATISGDAEAQHRDTVAATQVLCDVLKAQEVPPRLILISSIAVYGHDAVPEGGMVDEQTELEAAPFKRDIYCQNKLAQEEICKAAGVPLTILRPGAVYGPGQVWNAHLGAVLGPVLVQFSSGGRLPVTYLDNCAAAMVKAAETGVEGPINLIDPQPPGRAFYLQSIGLRKRHIFLSWRLLTALGGLIPIQGKPGLLHPATVQSRMMPLNYDTSKMQELMQGKTLIPFAEAIAISAGASG